MISRTRTYHRMCVLNMRVRFIRCVFHINVFLCIRFMIPPFCQPLGNKVVGSKAIICQITFVRVRLHFLLPPSDNPVKWFVSQRPSTSAPVKLAAGDKGGPVSAAAAK